jgi:hypothetical protein
MSDDNTTVTDSPEPDLREYIKSRLTRYPMLQLHLVSAHCNAAALGLTAAQARDAHQHEHDGPGTIRNHPRSSTLWDADKVADIIIEAASEYDTSEEVRAEVDRLMAPGEEKVVMAPTDHAHTYTPGQDWEVCADALDCEVYPRVYDINTTKSVDGTYGASSYSTITNPEDDITRAIMAARGALVFMEIDNENNGLGDMARDALGKLTIASALLYPRLYPEHAAKYKDEDPA